VDLAADKKAVDIVLMDLRQITTLADYFVICTGESERQLRAIVDDITETIRNEGERPLHHEGDSGSGWVLLDYGGVVLHVFAPQEREYYRLERLWQSAPTVLRVQ
jgi:ribosome-associated protein